MWKKNLDVDVKLGTLEWQVYLDKTKAGDFSLAALVVARLHRPDDLHGHVGDGWRKQRHPIQP